MDDQQFWSIIEAGGEEVLKDREQQLEVVRAELRKLSSEEVGAFQYLFQEKKNEAYTLGLWEVSGLIFRGNTDNENAGCTSDGFMDFRAWLISRGKELYRAALQNPDTLAAIVSPGLDEDYEFELLSYVGMEVYQELTGDELPLKYLPWSPEPTFEYRDDEKVWRDFPVLAKLYHQ